MSRKNLFLITILIVAAFINFLGALGPETGFDALWYHLTIPKLYISHGSIYHIPGGLLYYSELPRLAEILYIPLIKMLGDTGPHLLSWAAGIGTATLLYQLSRKYLDQFASLLIVCIWYVTPLVGWQSGSAYVDPLRTFFEILAVYLVLNRRIGIAGLALGLAISTKSLALGSIPILALITWLTTRKLRDSMVLIFISLVVSLPWFFSAFLNTGYPLYPIGAGILDSRHVPNFDLWNLPKLFAEFWKLWLSPEDIISPIYLILLPFAILNIKKLWPKYSPLFVYSTLSYLIWYITPRTGGGRFILPYLPVWAVLAGATISLTKDQLVKSALTFTLLLISIINLTYRVAATTRLFPYLMGRETKTHYLCRNLDTGIGNFIDCDGFFAKNIRPTDTVLVSGIHNLYYVNFPFIHESWYRGEQFDYFLTQGQTIETIKITQDLTMVKNIDQANWKLLYQNTQTKVILYKRL